MTAKRREHRVALQGLVADNPHGVVHVLLAETDFPLMCRPPSEPGILDPVHPIC